MVSIKYENGEIKLYISNLEVPLAFTLDVALEAEKQFGGLEETFKGLTMLTNCFWILSKMANAAIKAHNAEFGAKEKPIDGPFIVKEIGKSLETSTIQEVVGITRATQNILTGSLPEDDGKNAETGQGRT